MILNKSDCSTRKASMLESQDYLWLLNNSDSAANNVTETVTIDGIVDIESLRAALRRLTLKHDALRTRYSNSEEGQCLRFVEPEVLSLPIAEHENVCTDATENKQLVSQLNDTRFKHDDFPLWRGLVAIDHEKQQTLFGLTVQHIICDGHSMGVLLYDLWRYYREIASGTIENEVAEYSLEDYIFSHNQWVENGGIDKSLKWLNRKYSNRIEGLEETPEKLQNNTGAPLEATMLYSKLGDDEYRISRSLCERNRIDENTLYLALGSLAIGAMLGKKRFVSPVAYSGRHIPHTEAIVGKLYTQLPLFVDLDEQSSFSDFLSVISSDWLSLKLRLGLIPMAALHDALYPNIPFMEKQSPFTTSLLSILPMADTPNNFKTTLYLTVNSVQLLIQPSPGQVGIFIKCPTIHVAYYENCSSLLDSLFSQAIRHPNTKLRDLLSQFQETYSFR